MNIPPKYPRIYHITHIKNLQNILSTGGLLSDSLLLKRGGPTQQVGMSHIKRRRLEEIEVSCHPGTKVGEYVPFYFCPRSVMLYILHRGNHPDIKYDGGQEPIIHLEADLHQVVKWAEANNVRWAFSLSNAGSYYVEFRNNLQSLDELDWSAIFATDFRDRDVMEKKQAEFLVYEFFPFELVKRVGVCTQSIQIKVCKILAGSSYSPKVEIRKNWYYKK